MRSTASVPLWLRIHERIDFYLFVLKHLADQEATTPMDRLVDEATGIEEHRRREFSRVQRHLLRLKRLYDMHGGL
jgi:hypothetical protein